MVVWRFVSCTVLTATLVAGCSSATPAPTPPASHPPVVKNLVPIFAGASDWGPPNFTDDGPGSLVSLDIMHGNEELEDSDATYARIVYRSTSARRAGSRHFPATAS
jgi:hypothetical protein